MRTLLAGAALMGFLATAAAAENRHDENIDRAAANIVAGKMGDIRGGFSYDSRLVLVVPPDEASTASAPAPSVTTAGDPWKDGLAPAVERKLSVF
jgi:hypothetical protein